MPSPNDLRLPHSEEAEQVVLGSMMMLEVIADEVAPLVSEQEFYNPANQTIYRTILQLRDEAQPTSTVAVTQALRSSGELSQVGGASYIDTLEDRGRTSEATHFAAIIRDYATRRRLIQFHQRGMQSAQDGSGVTVPELIQDAQNTLDTVSTTRVANDVVGAAETLQTTYDMLEELSTRTGEVSGVPTGFYDLDILTSGLHAGQMVVIAARPAVGKALALTTPLPTPTGWTTMGAVTEGDYLLNADGSPTRVTAVTEPMTNRECFEVEFSDGTVIIADAQHQWLTETPYETRHNPAFPRPRGSVKTTIEIAATLNNATDGQPAHTVSVAAPLSLPEQNLPVDPYYLGVWLGNGNEHNATITNPKTEVLDNLTNAGFVTERTDLTMQNSDRKVWTVSEVESTELHLTSKLRDLQVLGNKRVPPTYLRASETQRRHLLSGVADTSGTVSVYGTVTIETTNKELASDVAELVNSLGLQSFSVTCHNDDETATQATCRVTFKPSFNVFTTKTRFVVPEPDYTAASRTIVDVRKTTTVPVKCVEVDNTQHLYLASRSMIPTHNSTLGLDIARSVSVTHGEPALIFSLEMSREEIMMRMLSATCRIPLQKVRSGKMEDHEWQKITQVWEPISNAPLFIDDSANITMSEIRTKARRIKARYGLSLIVVDYLQLMQGDRRSENRQQEVSDISRGMKLLAKELMVPVIAMSQLNRGSEQRADKKPALTDLRESGSIEQDADIVVLLYREDQNDPQSSRVGEADFIIAKHRNGPTGTLTVAFQGHYSRFVDMAREP